MVEILFTCTAASPIVLMFGPIVFYGIGVGMGFLLGKAKWGHSHE